MSKTSDDATVPMIRRNEYMRKYDIGATTFHKWDAERRIKTAKIGGIRYAGDKLPVPDSTNSPKT